MIVCTGPGIYGIGAPPHPRGTHSHVCTRRPCSRVLSIFSHYSPPNMLRRVVVVGEVGRRGTVEVCFVRRLPWYFIFYFFFTPSPSSTAQGEKNQWIRTFPPLPRCSNIYLNVLSINITRLLLEHFAEGIQFKGSYIRFARLKTANRLRGAELSQHPPTIPDPSHHHPLIHPPLHPPPPPLPASNSLSSHP